MTINTWIKDELVTVDTEQVWAETFAHWDTLVTTEAAERIATATVAILQEFSE